MTVKRRRTELCASCHEAARATELLCRGCRDLADQLIADLDPMYALETGTGPWDMILLPKPRERVPGSVAGMKY
jgi:hypothetical protein